MTVMLSDKPKSDRLCNELLIKRGILKVKTFKRKPSTVAGTPINQYFATMFRNHIWASHCENGDGFEVLKTLMDDSKLVNVFSGRGNREIHFSKLIPVGLKNSKTWNSLSDMMLEFTSKGKGAGEFYFPFVAKDCKLIKSSEGKHDGLINGLVSEYKKDGASLTPYHKSLRVIDDAVNKIFQGHRPGPLNPGSKSNGQSFDNFRQWLDSQKNPSKILFDFFGMLWPNQDVTRLIDKIKLENNGQKFYNTVGQHVLHAYKDIDKWQQLIVIGKKKLVIIEDPSDLSMFKTLKFKWVTKRGGDNQSLSDGYVNLKIE